MKLLVSTCVAAKAAMLVCTTGVAAQAPVHPDFSGTWVLDLARSDDGQSTPSSATYRITQHGDSLVYDRESASLRGTAQAHMILGVDGKTWKNVVPQNGQDVPTSSILSWDKNVLIIRSSGAMESSTVDTYETWTMAPDRKSFVMHREVSVNDQIYANTNLTFVRKENP